MRFAHTLLLVAAAGMAGGVLPLSTALAQVGAKADELDIRRITLYRSGVGSFERRGKVDGVETVQLRFKTEQINDILKSMVVLDLGGGAIEGISYGSKEPLAKRLSSFGVDISGNPSLAGLLGSLRGAAASVQTSEGAVSGTILGVELREVAQGQSQEPIQVPFLNLVTGGGMRSVDLSKVGGVELMDKELSAELSKALAALAEHRADRTKTVELAFRGTGQRDVVVNYIHEMPVWKTSYRLVLPDDAGGATAGAAAATPQVMMQGWAIVENPTDEDWNSVSLALVSGRPVSFQMDLYEPLYVSRPEIPVPTVPGVAPRVYAEGQSAGVANFGVTSKMAERSEAGEGLARRARRDTAPSPDAPGSAAGGGRGREFAGLADAAPGDPLSAEDLSAYAARAQAAAVEVGEVFQYQLKSPVTIERQRSAMLPIISDPVGGRRVSIFNRGDGSEHPMRGIELTNSTPLQLLPGPVSVFDAGAYAGDAQIGHVGPGDKRLLAYAVDLDVSTQIKDEPGVETRKLRLVGGLLEVTQMTRSKTTYTFANKSEKTPRTIIVEETKLPGHELVADVKPIESTPAQYRFEVTADAGKSATLVVAQERVFAQQVGVFSYDTPTLLSWQQSGKVSKAVVDAIKEAGRLQNEVNETERRIREMEAETRAIADEQGRVRENMKTIDRQSQLYTRYMTKLSEQETRVEELSAALKTAREDLQKRRDRFNSYVSSLNVE